MSDFLPATLPSGDELRTAAYIANQVAGTEFVPAALRGKAPAVLAAVLTARELRIGPMEALAKIHVIEGRVAVSPELMRKLVLRAGHSYRPVVYTNDRVVIEGKRADNGDTATVEWTLDDAVRAGLCQLKDGRPYARSKNNQPLSWEKYPRAMLLARATAELCRLLFPDAISGMSYVPEELGEDDAPPEEPIVLEIQAVNAVGDDYAPPEPPASVDRETGEIIDVQPATVEDAAPTPAAPTWDEPPPPKQEEASIGAAALAVMAKGANLKWSTMVGIARAKAASEGVPDEDLPDLGPKADDIHRLDDFERFLPYLREAIEGRTG